MSTDGSLESQPLFKLGQWVNGQIDAAIGAAVGLFDQALQRPAELVTLIAVVGLGCAVLAWLLGALFSRANRPGRREPATPPAAVPAVVIQTAKAPRIGRAAPARRSAAGRSKRRPRRRRANPILRWLGLA